jgi:hypothetical protein
MPLEYRIDAGAGIVTIRGDYADAGEWRVLLGAVAHDPDFRPGLAFIRDLRGSSQPVGAETVVGIMAVVRELWSSLGVRRAAIVTRPGIDLPAMVAHALAEEAHLPVQSFTSYDDAMMWLREG